MGRAGGTVRVSTTWPCKVAFSRAMVGLGTAGATKENGTDDVAGEGGVPALAEPCAKAIMPSSMHAVSLNRINCPPAEYPPGFGDGLRLK